LTRKKIDITKIVLVLFGIIVVTWSLSPIVWIFLTGLKENKEIYVWPPTWLPSAPTLRNFIDVFVQRPFPYYFRNSAIVAISTVIISCGLSILAGYGFSKFRFKGSALCFILVLLSRTVPPPSLLIPFYVIGRYFRIINTHFILVMSYVYISLPLNIWIVKGFFDSFPDELIDAAEVDGCSRVRALGKIVLPNLLPAFVAIAIITFLLGWNELLYGVVFTTTPAARTISPGLTDFFGDFHIFWGQLSAAAFLSMIPVIIFTILFSKYMIKGLVAGAIKG